jgi:hypothetical protein
MQKVTSEILKVVQDCIEFEGYTQNLSLLINHKLSHNERMIAVDEISNLLSESSAPKS